MSDNDDSYNEDLFASPSKKSTTPKEQPPPRSTTPLAPPPNSARYHDTEENRDANLRRELEGVRNINELIEGVIGTLERAKGNMQVRHSPSPFPPHTNDASTNSHPLDRLQHREHSLHPPQHLDAHPLADRAQPAANPEPILARRHRGPRRDRSRGRGQTTRG